MFESSIGITVLSDETVNYISKWGTYELPLRPELHAVVELFILDKMNINIQSENLVRYGKHAGTRLQLCTQYGKVDYNPKFIWNGTDWLLITHGYFVFHEVSFNEEKSTN